MMQPFDAYSMYNALKLHFEQDSYDAVKYNFKSNVSSKSFFARKDKYFFAKLAKNYDDKLLQYYIANFKNGVSYVGDMLNEGGETNFKEHMKIRESIHREFQKDINEFIQNCKSSENEKGFIVENLFEIKINSTYKFMTGPFVEKIFQIINYQKGKLRILIGNLHTTIEPKEHLFRPI